MSGVEWQINKEIAIRGSLLVSSKPTAGDHFRENERVRLRGLEILREDYERHLPKRLAQLAAGRMTQKEFNDWVRSNCFIVESKRRL